MTNQNLQIKERQILVDPLSLTDSSRREPSFNLMLPPVVSPSPPVKLPVVSWSLPSSPRFSLAFLKKKWKNESQASPRQIDRLGYGHSDPVGAGEDELNLRRSKSCAEGRSSSRAVDELDFLFSTKPNVVQFSNKLPEANKQQVKKEKKKNGNHDDEEEFKCNALCIYLPGFGKVKPVRSNKELQDEEMMGGVISRTVSLEKFECGSWASSRITNDYEGDHSGLYFDLPLELIQISSGNDTTCPVSAAFIFDKDHRKGVVKHHHRHHLHGSTTTTRRSTCDSSRHVRFSTSSSPSSPSSCITPRLRKAREDFNAFLEAQSA